jgi:hypothetical protein
MAFTPAERADLRERISLDPSMFMTKSRYLRDVKDAPWQAKIYCHHSKKADRLIAVILSDGKLITADNLEVSIARATEPIGTSCPVCWRRRGRWSLDPVAVRSRMSEGSRLDFIDASKVGIQRLL